MHHRTSRRRATRAIAALLVVTFLGACSTGPTAIGDPPRVNAPNAARHDGDPPPPDGTCRSGWQILDGHWYCAD